MKGKTHLVFTGIAATALYNVTPHGLPFALGCIAGSLLPDADHPRSLAGKILPLWLVTEHRGPIHSVLACGIASAAAGWFFGQNVGIGVLLGFATHLFADSFTASKLPYAWWYPFRRTGRSLTHE